MYILQWATPPLSSEEQVSGDNGEDVEHHKPMSKECRRPLHSSNVSRHRVSTVRWQYSKRGQGVCPCVCDLQADWGLAQNTCLDPPSEALRTRLSRKNRFVVLPEPWVHSLTVTKTNKCLHNLRSDLKHVQIWSPFRLLPHLKAWRQFYPSFMWVMLYKRKRHKEGVPLSQLNHEHILFINT